MKFSTSFATLLLSTIVTSEGLSFFGGNQRVFDDSLAVPGESPLEYCQPNHEKDILIIHHVNLKPNPPVAGETLTIEAIGTFTEDVEEGAYIQLQVKYGLIRLINTKADLCEQIKNVDMECPIKKGKKPISKDVELPNEIPPGKYTVLADVYTKDDAHITCLTAEVVFSK